MSAEPVQNAIAKAEALYNTGKFAEAVAAYRIIVEQYPGNAQALNNLGNALKNTRQLNESAEYYRKAIALRPDIPELHFNLGSVLAEADDLDAAIVEFESCLRSRPDFAAARVNYGGALRTVGRLHEAAEQLQRANSASDFLYLLHFMMGTTAQSLLAAHRAWGRQFPPPAKHPQRARSTRIRVGYVSPDFRSHPLANFLLPLISNHDRSRFETFAYDNTPIGDALGERMLALIEHRRSIVRLDDAQVDAMIRADRIDILVDLSLHMGGNRLLVFARKPAPVQLTWFGYPSTTGLEAMDYRLSDPVLDPPGQHDADYVETTIRLPNAFWCYDPITPVPVVEAPPAEKLGYITFGCLNNFSKVTDETLNLWSQVMQQTPGSRLMLLAPRGSARSIVAQKLGKQGIVDSRIIFVDRLPRPEYLRAYHAIDIALDTVPCCGHTTTLDALWMGTPVVTRTGPTCISRGAASILHQAGFDELITHNDADFVRCAVKLANDLPRLRAMRHGLRERLERSPLMDGPRFARAMESIYVDVWERWMNGVAPSAIS